MARKVIETETVRIWVDEHGILRVGIIPGAHLTLKDAKANVDFMHELAADKKHPVLVEMKEIKGMDGDARSYSAGDNVAGITSALAMVIGSPLGKTLGNLWLGINKPPFPTRMFTVEAEAVEWLKGFV